LVIFLYLQKSSTISPASALTAISEFLLPVHHKAQDYVAEYLEKASFEPNKPLFQTFHNKAPTGRAMSRCEAYRMIRRRSLAAGIIDEIDATDISI
jgi:hypothetical protein